MKQLCAAEPTAILVALYLLSGCATQSAYNELASEQDRCAGYWMRSGDSHRGTEMNRRANESRRAASKVGAWDDFFGEILVSLFTGNRSPQRVKQPPHPSDSRGCE